MSLKSIVKPQPQRIPMTIQEVTAAVLKSRGIHEGYWRLSLVTGDAVGVNVEGQGQVPVHAVMTTVTGYLLIQTDERDAAGVAAELVNPKRVIAMS